MLKRYFSASGALMAPLMLALAGCMPGAPAGRLDMAPADFHQLAGWEHEDHVQLADMVAVECTRMARLPEGTSLGGANTLPYGRYVKDWRGVCASVTTVRNGPPAQAKQFFETWFQPYSVTTGAFYTGYYDPEVEASLTRGGAYQVPVYRRPKDLLRGRDEEGELEFGHWVNSVFRPYDDRATIDGGSLEGKGLELAWLKSPVDLLFLQTQGSGRLHLQDGRELFVGYDGRNGQPYIPVGRVLVRRGLMRAEDVNAQSIRDWLAAHPDQVQSILDENPSYVFFRPVQRRADEGPKGGFGLPLTPQRSLAVDRKLISYGMPVWIDMSGQDRQGQAVDWARMAFAQDTGSDIRGAGRGDIFLGWGEKAQEIAGNMKNHGRMFLLIPRPPAEETTSQPETPAASQAGSSAGGVGSGEKAASGGQTAR